MTEEEKDLKIAFQQECRNIPEKLGQWADEHGIAFQEQQTDLFNGWFELRHGNKWLRISFRAPEELGTTALNQGAWGLQIINNFWKQTLVLYSDGWKLSEEGRAGDGDLV